MNPTGTIVIVQSKANQVVLEVPLVHGLTIGRKAGCGIQLEDREISRNQARLVQEGQAWLLVDVGSRNGTDLDGQRLAPQGHGRVHNGSVARIGPFELHFRLPTDAAAITKKLETPAAPRASAAPSAPLWTPEPEPPPPPSPLMSHLLDPRTRIPVWSEGEAVVKVAEIIEETADTKTFRLVGETPLLFSFQPGQFITLNLEIEGQKVRRSYSISSSPSRPHALEITVKRVRGGLVSNYLNDHVKLGQRIPIRGPAGKFSCFNYPSRKILAIAGGSGITPVMSMARWIVDTAADVDFTLVYSARSPQDMIFRRELEWMSSRHSGFRVLVTVTSRWHGVDAWTGCTGRVDDRLLRMAVPDLEERHAFLCGPAPFMEGVKETLKSVEFPLAHLHLESFGAGRVAKGAAPAQPAPFQVVRVGGPPLEEARPSPTGPVAAAPAAAAFAVSNPPTPPAPSSGSAPPAQVAAVDVTGAGNLSILFSNSAKSIATDGDTPLLELAEQCGVELEYGCRSGSCGSCRVRCAPAAVELPADCALSDQDRSEGWVLACVALPRSSLEVLA